MKELEKQQKEMEENADRQFATDNGSAGEYYFKSKNYHCHSTNKFKKINF